MLLKLPRLSYLLITMSLVGCSSSVGANCESREVKLQSVEFLDAVAERLREKEIWHSVNGNNQIEFCIEDHSKILRVILEVSEEFLPIGRSVSYAPRLHEMFKKELTQEGITFREQFHDGSYWVIWSTEDSERVRTIQERLNQTVLERPDLLNN